MLEETTSRSGINPANQFPCMVLISLMQGYDSVVLNSDLELGGTDQKFNLLMEEMSDFFGQEVQCILTMPILEGLDGVDKMSKSKNNYIGLKDEADQMFGKIMSYQTS